jgi:hypothetical protein
MPDAARLATASGNRFTLAGVEQLEAFGLSIP